MGPPPLECLVRSHQDVALRSANDCHFQGRTRIGCRFERGKITIRDHVAL